VGGAAFTPGRMCSEVRPLRAVLQMRNVDLKMRDSSPRSGCFGVDKENFRVVARSELGPVMCI
jgi:hypothetical protein